MAVGTPFPEVLSEARAGAAWAFEVLYRDLGPSVTGYLRLHGALEPDDLASETFLGLFTGLSSFEGDEGALRAWVFTIAHRRLVDDWRRRSRRPLVTGSDDDLLGEAAGGRSAADGHRPSLRPSPRRVMRPVAISRWPPVRMVRGIQAVRVFLSTRCRRSP